MKNILSNLSEKITLLTENCDTSKTTIEKFVDTLNMRASINPISNFDDYKSLFEVIFLKPPIKFKNTLFSGIKWNNKTYKNKTHFKTFQKKYLKGTIEEIQR